MNPTIQTFLRALQTPDTSLKSLTAARAATDAAGLPRLQRSTRFAEAEIAWRNGQWLLSMPLTSAALPRIERTVSRLRRLNTPWAGEYRILPGELRWEDAAGTARSTDLVMEALPAGCPFEQALLTQERQTLLAALETGCENVGVCIDTGHGFMAGENVAEAAVLAKRAGDKLFHMHFNDNHGSWDDDMIVSSVHMTTYVELLFWLKRTNYKGWLSMDQYPYREDAIDAISESLYWVKKYEEIVEEYYTEIEELIQANDAVATSRFLRRLVK